MYVKSNLVYLLQLCLTLFTSGIGERVCKDLLLCSDDQVDAQYC